MEDLRLLPVHKYPEYLEPCWAVLNEEWPRSGTARMMSLKASCDQMPTCFVLISSDVVIGHCKLTPIPSIYTSCFVESVVIKKELRGRKLGTYLMAKVEEYCRDVLHLSTVHLSTTNQLLFYKKLGYSECEPVSIYGGQLGSYVASQPRISNANEKPPRSISGKKTNTNSVPPPPPPLPQLKPANAILNNKQNKTFLMKTL